jgi:hypothetical protein
MCIDYYCNEVFSTDAKKLVFSLMIHS